MIARDAEPNGHRKEPRPRIDTTPRPDDSYHHDGARPLSRAECERIWQHVVDASGGGGVAVGADYATGVDKHAAWCLRHSRQCTTPEQCIVTGGCTS